MAALWRSEDTGKTQRAASPVINVKLMVSNMDADVPPPLGRPGKWVFFDDFLAVTRLVSFWD